MKPVPQKKRPFWVRKAVFWSNSINPALGFGVNSKHTYFLPDGLAQN